MIRVSVSGAAGRMGRQVVEAVEAAADLEVAHLYDPHHPGALVGDHPVSDDPEGVGGGDVVVEFTHPDVVLANLELWDALGVHAVVGTSGFSDERLDSVRALWSAEAGRCLIVPNFAVGAVLMMRFAELAAPHFPAGEIIELHHDRKADAPSGTALSTAARMAAARPDQQRAVESHELVEGALGAGVDGVRVHSVRLAGLVAHQEVIFGGVGQTLSIRHDTTDRNAFMPGVLLAVRGVADLAEPVTVGLEPLLGI